jgi:predicted nucleic acid-binding protein
MTAPVFVDTNVLLYARDAGEPVKQPLAASWLEYLWREQLGRTSLQVLSEYYVNVTRKLAPGLPPEEAWDDVQAFLTWRPYPIDEALMQRGREIEQRYQLSWWDSLVVGAAQLQGCALLLTEDLQDGGIYGGVTVRSPFTLALGEAAAAYTAVPAATSRHPLRGRPKRGMR